MGRAPLRQAVRIDTGFGPQAAAQRRRTLLRPAEALRPMGIEAARVDDVILTHLLPTVASIGRVRHLRRLADTPDHIVPGHDPLVLARYRAPSAGLDGVVVRLDEAPRREEARP